MTVQGMAVQPPVQLMRPVRAAAVPVATSLPGTASFEPKLDGWRVAAFVYPDGRVKLRSRSGRSLTDRFPEVVRALSGLPGGTVADGELVVFRDGAFSFTDLARAAAARRGIGAAVSLVAFDLLCHQGRDIRGLPLSGRRELLAEVLHGAGPELQPILSTGDRDEALAWMQALAPLGVEGVVAKGLASAYRPGRTADRWLKHRWADSTDATVLELVAPTSRRPALRLRLADGSTAVTAPLSAAQIRDLHTAVQAGNRDLVAEVRITAGRHGAVRFLRLREP